MPKDKEYKSQRKYSCPFCQERHTRSDLVDHVNKEHEELIPEGYTAARVVYESVNKKTYGTCMVCHKKVYEWDEKIVRYKNLCNDTKCREAVRNTAVNRMIRVHNKPTLLGDPEHQEKMLAARRISGKYKFKDGEYREYTGSYEKKCLEFMDKVMNIPAKDIQSPGPVFYYEYNGERHFWITDIFYIPANLVIEIKDGGSNPNTRSMETYRAKQLAKEKMITDNGTYNYLRLTDNDFSQLLAILADIKYDMIEPDRGVKIRINETVGGLANSPAFSFIQGTTTGAHRGGTYVVPILLDGIGDEDRITAGVLDFDELEETFYYHNPYTKKLEIRPFDESKYNFMLKYKGDNADKKRRILKKLVRENSNLKENAIFSLFLGHTPMILDEVFFSDNFEIKKSNHNDMIDALAYCGMIKESYQNRSIYEHKVDGFISIADTPDGYYIHTPYQDEFHEVFITSKPYKSMSDITQDEIEKVYEAYNTAIRKDVD